MQSSLSGLFYLGEIIMSNNCLKQILCSGKKTVINTSKIESIQEDDIYCETVYTRITMESGDKFIIYADLKKTMELLNWDNCNEK